jgi:hypothetical protein
MGRTSAGCRFAPRCPHVMDDCWTTIPPKFRLDPDRLAACFLYRDRGIAPSPDVAAVFKPAEASSPLGTPSPTAANR